MNFIITRIMLLPMMFAMLVLPQPTHSLLCAAKVASCPLNENKVEERRRTYNCSSPFFYTCLPDAYYDFYERCSPAFYIINGSGRCPYIARCHNQLGFIYTNLGNFKPCPQNKTGCPPVYKSSYKIQDLYKYPACFYKDGNIPLVIKSTESSTKQVPLWLIGLFAIIITVFLTCLAIYKWKIRKKESKKEEETIEKGYSRKNEEESMIHKKNNLDIQVTDLLLGLHSTDLDGSDRSGSSQPLCFVPHSSSNRPHSENTANNNQSPNKVTRSQSATNSSTGQGRRRYSQGTKNNGSMKRGVHCTTGPTSSQSSTSHQARHQNTINSTTTKENSLSGWKTPSGTTAESPKVGRNITSSTATRATMPKKITSSALSTQKNSAMPTSASIPRSRAGRSETFSPGDARVQIPNENPTRTTNGQDIRRLLVFHSP